MLKPLLLDSCSMIEMHVYCYHYQSSQASLIVYIAARDTPLCNQWRQQDFFFWGGVGIVHLDPTGTGSRLDKRNFIFCNYSVKITKTFSFRLKIKMSFLCQHFLGTPLIATIKLCKKLCFDVKIVKISLKSVNTNQNIQQLPTQHF